MQERYKQVESKFFAVLIRIFSSRRNWGYLGEIKEGRVGFKEKIRDWGYVDGPKATRRAWEIRINVIYTK